MDYETHETDVSAPHPTPLAYDIPGACAVSGDNGRTAIYRAIADGELPAKKFGRKTLILRSDLLSWLQSLPAIDDVPKIVVRR